MKKAWKPLIFTLLLAGCTEAATPEPINEDHKAYLSEKGWTPSEQLSMETEEIYLYPELLEQLQGYGLDLAEYNQNGTEADTYTYLLEEEQTTGDQIRVVIYEIDGELIGGYGVLEEWTPGGFSLDEKSRLVEDGVVE
ncbi:DUF4830 domain-containing protein [Jeotgalibacillus sp. JSM ZJ347]|uniref:DUF4830 domain-containing protein n=1 Tax=Jeotgalibacillus sp. JSM ZJ347 TaxID=3342117 RepID=UPI0035A918C8